MIVALANTPSVVAVIPTLGRDTKRLQTCISSINSSTGSRDVGVIVVWNSIEKPPLELAPAKLLVPGINLGFPGALTYARKYFSAEFLWVIQDDVQVLEGCLEALLSEQLLHKPPAIVTPVPLNDSGNIPAGSGRGGLFDSKGHIWVSYPIEDVAPENFECPSPLGYVASSGALVPSVVWDAVGGYDPEFFPLLWSDADFCYRAGLLGYPSIVAPTAHIRHAVHGSTPPLLNQHLTVFNGERFRNKHFTAGSLYEERLIVDVDAELLEAVARIASMSVINFGVFTTKALKDLNNLVDALSADLAGIKQSKVWRYSKPLRQVRRYLSRPKRRTTE